jgi:aspartyl-tRNA(Asn)/glutamyl-tRNA(Gln) amidotransferase subunit C
MAKITHSDVLKLARLSKIKLTDDEIDKFVDELGAIVKYIEQIDSADTAGLEPTDQVTGLKNVMRPDEITDYGETVSELLKNAPATEKKYIKVKRVLN